MWTEQITKYPYIRVINYQSPLAKAMVANSDIIVFDECHHAAAKTIYALAMECKTTATFVGLSATPKREDGEDMRVHGALGIIVYEISRRALIDLGYLADANVRYIKPLFDFRGDYLLNYAGLYAKHIVNNFDRNEAIIAAAEEYAAQGKKVLVLITQIEHGQAIFDALKCPPNKLFCHGSTDDRYKDLASYDVIVASNIFNEGINLPALDVVILGAGGKSSIQLTQRIGRVLRPKAHSAIIVDFVDTEPRYLEKHYKRRRAILEQDFTVTEDE
jgi:superfamily II DNA or RNA helicase